ncbi:IS66 family transposase [Mesorhizobium helmanticense]|uniref:IS66 family transposase n=1 Tax=Mesorhizobium helmanticense TaxID=1776423 RepID=UPI0024782964|nr:transposase [Mesorhizobium helmanticense]
MFRYAPGRSGSYAEQFLQSLRGTFLQCDGYDDHDCLTRIERPQGPRTLVHSWGHWRRRFVKQMPNTKSPAAEAAVRQIATLKAIEECVHGMPPIDRLAARKEHSTPIIATLRPSFEKQLSMISSGSTLATEFRYALTHWQGLTRFLEGGWPELATNPVENAIRPVALTRKNDRRARHSRRACSPLPAVDQASSIREDWASRDRMRVGLSFKAESKLAVGPGSDQSSSVCASTTYVRAHPSVCSNCQSARNGDPGSACKRALTHF